MGYDATAYAIVGLRLRSQQLTTQQRVRGCAHKLANEKVKFCPECGDPVWVTKRTPIAGYDDGEPTLASYRVVDSGPNSEYVYVAGVLLEGASGQDGGSVGFISEINFEEVKAKMKAVIEPLGLWDEESFGFWAVLNEDY